MEIVIEKRNPTRDSLALIINNRATDIERETMRMSYDPHK